MSISMNTYAEIRQLLHQSSTQRDITFCTSKQLDKSNDR